MAALLLLLWVSFMSTIVAQDVSLPAIVFSETNNTAIAGSNLAGFYSLAHEHVTLAQCQRLCQLNALCRSLDFESDKAGNPVSSGDCYLSHDNAATAPPDDFPKLNLYQVELNLSSTPLYVDNFNKTEDAFLSANNDGGIYNVASDEGCAALCLQDPSCLSFDIGRGYFAGRCFLSYTTRALAGEDDFVQYPPGGLGRPPLKYSYDYYEKLTDLGSPCPEGSVSPNGHVDLLLPPSRNCFQCPNNTFANAAQTACELCPTGYTSPGGSNGIASCQPTGDLSLAGGLLAVGDRFLGRYTCVEDFKFFKLTQDGQVELEVITAVETEEHLNVTVLVELMGELDYSLYYASGTVPLEQLNTSNTALNLKFVDQADFNAARVRPTLQGMLAADDTLLNYSGTLSTPRGARDGNCDGTFNAHRVCHLPEVGAVFEVGDQWVGSFLCADNLGTTSVTRADIIITGTNVTEDGVAFTGLYDFTGDDGFQGRYRVAGRYDPNTKGVVVLPDGADAWIDRPTNTLTGDFVGKLTEDHLLFSGQRDATPACSCNGLNRSFTDADNTTSVVGQDCGRAGRPDDVYDPRVTPWCYVDDACPDSTVDTVTGFRWKTCRTPATCGGFELHRVCPARGSDGEPSSVCDCLDLTTNELSAPACRVRTDSPVGDNVPLDNPWCLVDEACSLARAGVNQTWWRFCNVSTSSTTTPTPTTTMNTGSTDAMSSTIASSTPSSDQTTASTTPSSGTTGELTTAEEMVSTGESTTEATVSSTRGSAKPTASNGSSTTVPVIDLNDFVTDVTTASRVRITGVTPDDVSIAEFTDGYARTINTIAQSDMLTDRKVRVLELRAGSAIVSFVSTVTAEQAPLFYCASEEARKQQALLNTLQRVNGVYAASEQADDEVRYCTSCVAQDCEAVMAATGSRSADGGSSSSGNRTGIAIGVVVALIALVVAVVLLRRRSQRSASGGRREYIRGDLLEKEGGPAFSNPLFDAEPRTSPDRVTVVNETYANAADLYSNYGGDAASVNDDPGYMDVPGVGGNDAYLLYGGPVNSSTA
eukprot:m.175026 g.175026  ORF g.175026 m.175026 type:complete len:1044 (-) comp16765_c0_seq1:83-3214(-)